MLKLNTSRLALAGIFALSLVVVGVLSTEARDGRRAGAGTLDMLRPVQTAPLPVGTFYYPSPVPSYPPPVPSRFPLNTPTAKPTREPDPTATPHPWLRYVELIPANQR